MLSWIEYSTDLLLSILEILAIKFYNNNIIVFMPNFRAYRCFDGLIKALGYGILRWFFVELRHWSWIFFDYVQRTLENSIY